MTQSFGPHSLRVFLTFCGFLTKMSSECRHRVGKGWPLGPETRASEKQSDFLAFTDQTAFSMGTGVAFQFHSLCFSIISLVVFVFLNYLRCFARRPSVLGPLRGAGETCTLIFLSLWCFALRKRCLRVRPAPVRRRAECSPSLSEAQGGPGFTQRGVHGIHPL